jgi:hypothetical protein
MRPGLGRWPGREIALALGGFLRGNFSRRLGRGFLFQDGVQLRFRRRFRWLHVRLNYNPHDLTVHELVTIDMRPDAVVIRPAGREWRSRFHFQSRIRGFLFLRRRIGLQCGGCGETGQQGQRQNGSYHIFVFRTAISLRADIWGEGHGAATVGIRETVRDSRQKGNSNAIFFLLTGPTTAWAAKNVRGPGPRRSEQSRSPENQPRNKIRRRNASNARLDRKFPAAYPCARYDSPRRRGSLQLFKLFGVFPLNACQVAPFPGYHSP